MKDSIFFCFDYVEKLYYKCHKIGLKHGGSNKDFPKQTKTNKATINSKIMIINAVTVALNPAKIGKDLQTSSLL